MGVPFSNSQEQEENIVWTGSILGIIRASGWQCTTGRELPAILSLEKFGTGNTDIDFPKFIYMLLF